MRTVLNEARIVAGIFCLLSIIQVRPAFGQAYCPSLQTAASRPWTDNFGDQFTLNQSADGTISGSVLNTVDQTNSDGTGLCPAGSTFTVTGVMSTQKQFVITWTPNGNQCATPTYTGHVNAPVCNVVAGTWTSTNGGSGSFNLSMPAFLPTGESPSVFTGWSTLSGFSTAADFLTGLVPQTWNWGGRTVQESFQTPSTDTCWFSGSAVPKVTTVPSLSLALPSDGQYQDEVGPSESTTAYYRKKGKTPCGFENFQTMGVDGGQNAFGAIYVTYVQSNDLLLYMGNTTVTDARAGVGKTRTWGVPAPSVIVSQVVTSLVLLK